MSQWSSIIPEGARMGEARIQALGCWSGTIRCEAIPGGITNRNFRVEDDRGVHFVRLCEELEVLGINRRNEHVCHRAAAAAGVSPPVAHYEPGVLVSQHVTARTLSPDDVREPELLKRLAKTVRRLHDARDALTGEMLYFCPFQTVRTYTATARRLGAELPEDIDRLLAELPALFGRLRPFRPTLCHNDLLAANILDDGDRLWLVDWEYAGVANPLFDLASISANSGLSDDRECTLLEAYFGSYDEQTHQEVHVLKTVSLLREALWAVIQTVASDLEFDYHKYAADNLAAYAKARGNLPALGSNGVME